MLGISRDLFKQPVNSKPLLIKPGGLCESFALVAGDHKSSFHGGLSLPPPFLSFLPLQAGEGCRVVWWPVGERAPSLAPPELGSTRRGTGWASARSVFPARPCNQPYPELSGQASTSALIPLWLCRLSSQAGMGLGVPQGSRYSHEHLKHLPPQPITRLGAASPQGRQQRCSVPGAGVSSPRGCRFGGGPAQPASTTTLQGLLPSGEGVCSGGAMQQAGHSPHCPLRPMPAAACRPLGTNWSCRWQ